MKIDGQCHCGHMSYDAEIDPARVSICHCTDCQALTGTAYRVSVPTAREAFRLLEGTPKVYVKTAESGAQRGQAFCADCGSPLYAYAVDNPATYGLRVGGRLSHHNASTQVFAGEGGTSRVVWIADLLPHELAPAIAGMIEHGLRSMRKTLEESARRA